MSIGTTIKKLRRERDMTQEQLAEYLGITANAVSQWECDRTCPDISLLPSICNLFNVSSDELLGIDVGRKNAERQKAIGRSSRKNCISAINATSPSSQATIRNTLPAARAAMKCVSSGKERDSDP